MGSSWPFPEVNRLIAVVRNMLAGTTMEQFRLLRGKLCCDNGLCGAFIA
jgi:hypothetical protein